MKTLKFFLTFFIAMTFFALNSYSQKNVKTSVYIGPNELVNVQLPGVPETVSGSFEGWITDWNYKEQARTNGTYTGDETGTIYYTSVDYNYIWMNWMPGVVGLVMKFEYTSHIKDEFGNVYYNYHSTELLTRVKGETVTYKFNEHGY